MNHSHGYAHREVEMTWKNFHWEKHVRTMVSSSEKTKHYSDVLQTHHLLYMGTLKNFGLHICVPEILTKCDLVPLKTKMN